MPIEYNSVYPFSSDNKFLLLTTYDENTKKMTYSVLDTTDSGVKSFNVENNSPNNTSASLSPDGKLIAYQTPLGFWVHDIYTNQTAKIMDLTGKNSTYILNIVWNSNSSSLVFSDVVASGNNSPVETIDEGDNQGFWMSNINGSDLIKIDRYSEPLFWY